MIWWCERWGGGCSTRRRPPPRVKPPPRLEPPRLKPPCPVTPPPGEAWFSHEAAHEAVGAAGGGAAGGGAAGMRRRDAHHKWTAGDWSASEAQVQRALSCARMGKYATFQAKHVTHRGGVEPPLLHAWGKTPLLKLKNVTHGGGRRGSRHFRAKRWRTCRFTREHTADKPLLFFVGGAELASGDWARLDDYTARRGGGSTSCRCAPIAIPASTPVAAHAVAPIATPAAAPAAPLAAAPAVAPAAAPATTPTTTYPRATAATTAAAADPSRCRLCICALFCGAACTGGFKSCDET